MEETVRVPLTQGKVAIIDAADAERVLAYKWFAMSHHGNWHARRSGKTTNGRRPLVAMHRFIVDAPNGVQVDHINGDGLDNRRSNLRRCNNQQNSMNKHTHKPTITGYKGVYRPPGWRKYMAQIGFNGRRLHLGMHETAEGAARAYDEKARELFGEFAHTNFPQH